MYCRFSIVTPSLNCGKYIQRNIESVLAQNIKVEELEHIVVDGGSTDGTLEILDSFPHLRWKSEPDKGLSDAVNKGIRQANGDWIIWLNADDRLLPGALSRFIEFLDKHPEARFCTADQVILNYQGEEERINTGWEYTPAFLLNRRIGIVQASTFVHRSVYEEVGLMNTSLRYSMDYEWMIRASGKFKCYYNPVTLTVYNTRSGSITDAGQYRQYQEILSFRKSFGGKTFCPANFLIHYYIITQPLRRIRWFRLLVRKVRKLLGYPAVNSDSQL